MAGVMWAGCEAEPAQILPDAATDMRVDAFILDDLGPVDQRVPVDMAVDAMPDMIVDAAPPPECTFSTNPTLTRLTILHSGDGGSALVTDAQSGGIDRFVTVMRSLRARAEADETPVLALTTGDNLLAGAAFATSLEQGPPYLDAIGLAAAGFDAMALGEHEFDFGPAVLARFINSFTTAVEQNPEAGFTAPLVLGANLRVDDEPTLAPLRQGGRIVSQALIDGVGIIGVSAPEIAQISSPGAVEFDLPRGAIETAIAALETQSAEIIVLVSHLSDSALETRIAQTVPGIDVVIAGSTDALLANDPNDLHTGETAEGPYPRVVCGEDGRAVLMVSTGGDYRYVGRLVVEFDNAGVVTAIDPSSGPVKVTRIGTEAVEPDPIVEANVSAPVRAGLQAFANNEIALSAVELDGRRDSLREGETNLGSLVADAVLWAAEAQAIGGDAPPPDAALISADAIRNNSVLSAGSLTELDTFTVLPLPSFVVQVPPLSRAELKAILEHGVARSGAGAEQFPQVAGLRFTWDPRRPGRRLGLDGQIIQPGERVRSAALLDGTVLINNGAVVEGDPVNLVTLDYLSRGGDGYPFAMGGAPFGVAYQQALRDFVAGALEGEISAASYPAGGLGRIVRQE